MAGRFEQLDELLDESIELPVPIGNREEGRTKVYRIESPSGRDGLRIERLTNIAVQLASGSEDVNTELLDDDEELDLYRKLLGSNYDAMLADGVKWVWLRHASLAALLWVSSGMDAAERFWKAAGDPERMAPNRETRRQQQGSSAAAKSTRGRASTSGTNHGQGSNSRRHKGTRKSRGASSSKSGT